MSIKEREKEIESEFEIFEDWMEKYEYIIDLGKELPEMLASEKQPDNLIRGCQSQVWLTARNEEGKVSFNADSDAIITKGLVALMMRVLDGQKPEDIVSSELKFIDTIGLQEHLSPNRSNGLVAMIKQMKVYALALKK
ncbi:MAG: SufE family protein [Flavobacteriales bacterium]